jgi:vacuolar-type H+-ATPase subunit I/STV1
MSAPPRPVILRIIVPKTLANRVITSLGPQTKINASNLTLQTDQLTTEDIVRYIRELSQLRDELLQTIRQFNIGRDSNPRLDRFPKPDQILEEGRNLLSDTRATFQNARTQLESLERQADDTKRQATKIEQLGRAGFDLNAIGMEMPGFKRLIGRLPLKKAEAAEKALRAILSSDIIIAHGSREKEVVYLLIAVPNDSAHQAIQTLLQYEFVQFEIPEGALDNFRQVVESLVEKSRRLTSELELRRKETQRLNDNTGPALNALADKAQEMTMRLRAALRVGDGTNAAFIQTELEKPLPPQEVEMLVKEGVFDEEQA